MVYEFKQRRRIEFSDTDMAGIMHFSRIFVLMESTEHALIRSLGFSVHGTIGGVLYGWPRIEANCSFRKPLRFEDEVDIHLSIREITSKTVLYHFTLKKINGDKPGVVATGTLRVICVIIDKATNEMKAATIPREIRQHFEVAPEIK